MFERGCKADVREAGARQAGIWIIAVALSLAGCSSNLGSKPESNHNPLNLNTGQKTVSSRPSLNAPSSVTAAGQTVARVGGYGLIAAPEQQANKRSMLVIQNLVATLRQVPALQPQSSPISFKKPGTDFSRLLASQLQQAGYRLFLAESDTAPNLLVHAISRVAFSGEGRRYEFSLSINGMSVSRTYELKNNTIYPVTRMLIAGTGPLDIRVDDSVFEN